MKIKSKEQLSEIIQTELPVYFRRYNRSNRELEYFALVSIDYPELSFRPAPKETIFRLQKMIRDDFYQDGYIIEIDYETLVSTFVIARR